MQVRWQCVKDAGHGAVLGCNFSVAFLLWKQHCHTNSFLCQGTLTTAPKCCCLGGFFWESWFAQKKKTWGLVLSGGHGTEKGGLVTEKCFCIILTSSGCEKLVWFGQSPVLSVTKIQKKNSSFLDKSATDCSLFSVVVSCGNLQAACPQGHHTLCGFSFL